MAGTDNVTGELDRIDLTRLLVRGWKQLCKTWWLLLILLALGLVLRFGYQTLFHTDEYEAYASFSVSVGGSNTGMASYNTRVSLTQLGETFPYILESGALKKVVMEQLDLTSLPVQISANVVSDTSLFRISVRGTDPELASHVLDAIIENYPQVAKYVIGKTELTMLDYSGVPAQPVNGVGRGQILCQGLALGAVVYLAVLLFLTVARKTVESEEDLRRYTSLRCLAVVPRNYLKRRSGGNQPKLLVNQKSVSQSFVEAINLLRIRILREMDRTGKKVLLLTSTGELEGKSTISSNLALSCAQKGFRVLLIDGDLRSPSVAKKFGLETEAGILDVLTGGAALEQAIHHYPDTTLDILPGHGTANAAGISQLIGGEETAHVMEYAREHYDYVIVDSPPCGIIQDALMLAAHCDASLVVIRQDFLARTRILEMLDVLADTGTEILGCVINGEEGSVGSYGYGRYGYGSGYGYGKYGNYGKYGSGEKNGRKTEKSAPQGDV